ncbi:hypothetical protein [Cognataquiflexum aquatile]|uniref:hypothetical protein n=1 Tax=Cognataquiflexum aquatile TaxID=2249427 RepID=UPI000DEB0977|nr:hypothetical protein [Cognataquiflexum aquatile]
MKNLVSKLLFSFFSSVLSISGYSQDHNAECRSSISKVDTIKIFDPIAVGVVKGGKGISLYLPERELESILDQSMKAILNSDSLYLATNNPYFYLDPHKFPRLDFDYFKPRERISDNIYVMRFAREAHFLRFELSEDCYNYIEGNWESINLKSKKNRPRKVFVLVLFIM